MFQPLTIQVTNSQKPILEEAIKNFNLKSLVKMGDGIELNDSSLTIPFANDMFDCVISSLFFHHLDTASKLLTLQEIFRVLKENGRLLVADWGKPTSALMRTLFYQIQFLDGFSNTRDHVEGKFIEFMLKKGLINCQELDSLPTVFGNISIYRATKP